MDITELVQSYSETHQLPRGSRPFVPFNGDKYFVLSKFNVLIYNSILDYIKTNLNGNITDETTEDFKENLRIALREMVFLDVFGGSGVMSYSILKVLKWCASKCDYKGSFNIVFNDYDDVKRNFVRYNEYLENHLYFVQLCDRVLSEEEKLLCKHKSTKNNRKALYVSKVNNKKCFEKILLCLLETLPRFRREDPHHMLRLLKKIVLPSSLFEFKKTYGKSNEEVMLKLYDLACKGEYEEGLRILVDCVGILWFTIAGNFETLKKKNSNVKKNLEDFLFNIEIICKDYRDIFADYKESSNAFFICDPPYPFTNSYAYNMDSFTGKEYYALLKLLGNKKGILFGDNKSYILDFIDYVNYIAPDGKNHPFKTFFTIKSKLGSRGFLVKNKADFIKKDSEMQYEYLVYFNTDLLIKN